jgi:hypothetical protein
VDPEVLAGLTRPPHAGDLAVKKDGTGSAEHGPQRLRPSRVFDQQRPVSRLQEQVERPRIVQTMTSSFPDSPDTSTPRFDSAHLAPSGPVSCTPMSRTVVSVNVTTPGPAAELAPGK